MQLFSDQSGVCHWGSSGRCVRPGIPMQLGPARWGNGSNNELVATFEHLKKQCDGGTWEIDNLRLVHGICNWSRDNRARALSRRPDKEG